MSIARPSAMLWSLSVKLRPRVADITTDEEFGLLFLELVAAFRVVMLSCCRQRRKFQRCRCQAGTPASLVLRTIEERPWFTCSKQLVLIKSRIVHGFEISAGSVNAFDLRREIKNFHGVTRRQFAQCLERNASHVGQALGSMPNQSRLIGTLAAMRMR